MLLAVAIGEDMQCVDTLFCEVSVGCLETVHCGMIYYEKRNKTKPARHEPKPATGGCLHRLREDHCGLLNEVNALALENPLDVALVVEERGELGILRVDGLVAESGGYESQLVAER